jgi:tetratricopeptide (TPR) repeat protein
MRKTDKIQTIVQIPQKIGSVLAEAWSRAAARPRLFGGVAGGVVVAACAVALAFYGLSDSKAFDELRDLVGMKHTLPELVKIAQADPNDASIQVDLGNAYFEAGQRASALTAYDKALQLDETAATDLMIENLVSCYGRKEMGAAGAIITQYRLVSAEDELRVLVSDKRWLVRNGALNTLDGLNEAWRDDFLTVYTLDLAARDCDIRRGAVEKLGRLGDKRALDEIRAAKKRDQAATPWYAFSCLGDRPEDAEQRILAKR